MIKKLLNIEFIRFGIVGVINTLVGAGVMFALYNLAGAGYWLSSACNFIAGGTCSYFLNKRFTFRKSERDASYAVRFIVNLIVCWLLAYGLAKPLTIRLLSGNAGQKLTDNIAMLVGMVLYTVLGYFGQKFFVFGGKKGGKDR